MIDQFEEVFTAHDPHDAMDFLDALAVAATDPSSPLRLVLTLRADDFDRPLRHPAFAPIIDAAAGRGPPAGEPLPDGTGVATAMRHIARSAASDDTSAGSPRQRPSDRPPGIAWIVCCSGPC